MQKSEILHTHFLPLDSMTVSYFFAQFFYSMNFKVHLFLAIFIVFSHLRDKAQIFENSEEIQLLAEKSLFLKSTKNEGLSVFEKSEFLTECLNTKIRTKMFGVFAFFGQLFKNSIFSHFFKK